jgi:hypothetical protein
VQEVCIGDKCPLGYCSDYNRRERQPRGLCVTGDQAFPAPSATQADTGQEPLCCLPYSYMLPPQSLWEPGGYRWGLLRRARAQPRERSLVVAQDAPNPFRAVTSNHLDVRMKMRLALSRKSLGGRGFDRPGGNPLYPHSPEGPLTDVSSHRALKFCAIPGLVSSNAHNIILRRDQSQAGGRGGQTVTRWGLGWVGVGMTYDCTRIFVILEGSPTCDRTNHRVGQS